MKELGKYSFGIGDRFGQAGIAQIAAVQTAKILGVDVTPVWNKSHREHKTIGTKPEDTRTANKALVKNTRSGETIDEANMSELKAKQTAFIEDSTHMMLTSSITRIGRLSPTYITTGSK